MRSAVEMSPDKLFSLVENYFCCFLMSRLLRDALLFMSCDDVAASLMLLSDLSTLQLFIVPFEVKLPSIDLLLTLVS